MHLATTSRKAAATLLFKCWGFYNPEYASVHILSPLASIHSYLQITEFLNWVSFGPLLLYAVTTVKKTTYVLISGQKLIGNLVQCLIEC